MRIIAGRARGRKLATPAKKGVPPLIRPTADRAREALFSILGDRVQGVAVLDLFAGTGALGLEAVSRGAKNAVFVDHLADAVDLIRKNIDLCGFSTESLVYKRDLAKGLFFLEKTITGGFPLVFLDPPYGTGLAEKILTELGKGLLVSQDGLVVAEENFGAELLSHYGQLSMVDQRRYGDSAFWIYETMRNQTA